MTVVRRNILTDPVSRQAYIRGVQLLKQEFLGSTSRDYGIPGPAQPVSTYDLFVIWHHTAMGTFTPPTQSMRNAAHMGPAFLPWHRFMLINLEANLQRVLLNPTFALPYWNWATDGGQPRAQQTNSAVWASDCMGGEGFPVSTGPFAFDTANPNSFRVRIASNVNNQLMNTNRGLNRSFAQGIPSLPRVTQVAAAMRVSTFDRTPFDVTSSGFRNRLEGWQASTPGPGLHNRVHVWVGGDMSPASSPNDPVFYLNHCNVDRIWSAWIAKFGPRYVPAQTAGAELLGHRIDDAMNAFLSDPATPRQMLDVSATYSYDTLLP